QVTSWLKKIYRNQAIPAYPVNAKTVDYLYGIMERNEARDRDLTLLIEETKQQAAKCKAEANYLQGVLGESLVISPFTLSKKGVRSLDTLASSAMALETKDTSLNNLFCAINDMTSELYATESKNKKMKLELVNLSHKLTAMLILESNIKKDLKNVEETVELRKATADSRQHKLTFLEAKSRDLMVRIKDTQEEIIATGLDQSLMHDALMYLSE
ncbi:HAUS1 protein, partial [Aegotheles bennettii]|nr:HAUS1 protein [Aegotheles bennettii]